MPVIPGVIPSEAAKRRSRGIAIVPAAMSWFRCRVKRRTQTSQITLISQMTAYFLRRLFDDGVITAPRPR